MMCFDSIFAQDARLAAAAKKQRLEERKKRSLFATITDLKTVSKQEYREFRRQKFYPLPRDITVPSSISLSTTGSMSKSMHP
jgi:hypothetical protein